MTNEQAWTLWHPEKWYYVGNNLIARYIYMYFVKLWYQQFVLKNISYIKWSSSSPCFWFCCIIFMFYIYLLLAEVGGMSNELFVHQVNTVKPLSHETCITKKILVNTSRQRLVYWRMYASPGLNELNTCWLSGTNFQKSDLVSCQPIRSQVLEIIVK